MFCTGNQSFTGTRRYLSSLARCTSTTRTKPSGQQRLLPNDRCAHAYRTSADGPGFRQPELEAYLHGHRLSVQNNQVGSGPPMSASKFSRTARQRHAPASAGGTKSRTADVAGRLVVISLCFLHPIQASARRNNWSHRDRNTRLDPFFCQILLRPEWQTLKVYSRAAAALLLLRVMDRDARSACSTDRQRSSASAGVPGPALIPKGFGPLRLRLGVYERACDDMSAEGRTTFFFLLVERAVRQVDLCPFT